ncbi:MAG: hypothetical protein MJ236_06905 [Clostridia bacterium]|nr:hypothetical protein [Clostridia bacterium]
MSKYTPLWKWIKENKNDDFQLSFSEIFNILKFKIDHSFLNAKKELIDYGFKVTKISMKEECVYFEKTTR